MQELRTSGNPAHIPFVLSVEWTLNEKPFVFWKLGGTEPNFFILGKNRITFDGEQAWKVLV